MNNHRVTFKQKMDANVDWDDIQGVQLVVRAQGEFDLFIKVKADVDAASRNQLEEMNVDAACEASWIAPDGSTRAYEIVPNDLFV